VTKRDVHDAPPPPLQGGGGTDGEDGASPLCDILAIITRLRAGDLAVRAELGGAGDEHDAILLGLNMLAEDLQARERSRREAEARWVEQARYLARSDASHRIVAAHADGLVVLDRQGCILFANASAEATLGFASIGGSWPFDRMPLSEQRTTERELELSGGRTAWVEARVTSIAWEEQPALLVVVRDVSERRRLQADLLAAQRLGLVARLASGVAHDFNNLLATIIGNLDIIDQLGDLDSARRPLAAIADSANRAARLTSRLLAVGRRRVGMPSPVDLQDTINQMQGLLEQIVGARARLVILHDGPGPVVLADPVQIEQIVLNLVTNSRDAIRAEGRIQVRTSRIEAGGARPCRCVLEHEPQAMALLEVQDEGEGISPEHLGRIFEPFFSTRDEGIGTGLGLPTVQGIVERSGGHVCAESEIDRGTTLRVYLPELDSDPALIRPGEASPVPKAPSFEPFTPLLLIVDDEEGIREALAHCFLAEGYRVLQAASGEEALGRAASSTRPIDLLITDILMPGMDGWELSQALGATQPDMQTLFISGYGESALARHRLDRAAIEVLAKPFRLAQIKARVSALLPRDR